MHVFQSQKLQKLHLILNTKSQKTLMKYRTQQRHTAQYLNTTIQHLLQICSKAMSSLKVLMMQWILVLVVLHSQTVQMQMENLLVESKKFQQRQSLRQLMKRVEMQSLHSLKHTISVLGQQKMKTHLLQSVKQIKKERLASQRSSAKYLMK